MPGSTINYTPSTLGVGVHALTVNVTDGLGNWTADEILVTVLTDLALSRPADLRFTVGTTGHRLAWTPTATQVGSASYDILVDGNVVKSDVWSSGAAISVSLDALAPGTHNVTIIVRDGLGTMLLDEVAVTVVAAPGFPFEIVITAAVVGFGGLGVFLFLRARRRRTFYP